MRRSIAAASVVLCALPGLTFGVNAMRYIQRRNEQAWLVRVPKAESGLASRMAHREGLSGIVPHHSLEFLPYVVSRGEFLEPW